jgi:DNA-binding MarR family transcriptional regulator
VTAEERLQDAERLLDRLEEARSRLERTTDPDQAIEILAELSEIAKEVEAQLQAAKRESG